MNLNQSDDSMPWADLLGRYRIICIITGVRGFFPCLLFQSRGARFMHRWFNSSALAVSGPLAEELPAITFSAAAFPAAAFSAAAFSAAAFPAAAFPTEAFPAAVLSTAAFPGTLPDNLMEAFAQAGPTISYKSPLDRMMVESSWPLSAGACAAPAQPGRWKRRLRNQRQTKVAADFR